MRILWTAPARVELRAAMAYVHERNPAAAAAMLGRIQQSAARLADHPHSGRPGHVAGTRELVVPGAPCIVPCRIVGDAVQLLRVLHGARRWPEEM